MQTLVSFIVHLHTIVTIVAIFFLLYIKLKNKPNRRKIDINFTNIFVATSPSNNHPIYDHLDHILTLEDDEYRIEDAEKLVLLLLGNTFRIACADEDVAWTLFDDLVPLSAATGKPSSRISTFA